MHDKGFSFRRISHLHTQEYVSLAFIALSGTSPHAEQDSHSPTLANLVRLGSSVNCCVFAFALDLK